MCGIFAYLNHATPKKRGKIIEILIQGLRRMEYRGYDSAGIAIDYDDNILLFRKEGKVNVLNDYIAECEEFDFDCELVEHCGIAHTRWATHGQPSDANSHPQRSSPNNDFLVVHNGIITNYNDLKEFLLKKGYRFESETDTEVIAKLILYIHDRFSYFSFRQLVEATVQQLEGAFALAFKSPRFPGQLVVTRRGTPLLIGIKSENRSNRFDNFPVHYNRAFVWAWQNESKRRVSSRSDAGLVRINSTGSFDDFEVISTSGNSFLEGANRTFDSKNHPVEYFVASDASAIVEHTRQVIYLENDDIALIEDGALSLHRICREDGPCVSEQTREVQELNMELQEIMLGDFKTFMEKEIFEQPDSIINTMRGRLLRNGTVLLGGIREYANDIKRCRRLIMIACGTSYNSAIACRQIMEELTELPVILELASDFLDRQTPVFRDDVCLCISQSGETADTLNALRYVRPRGALTIGITNTVGSSICRESHCGIHINAGLEIGVASTKAYTSQILVLIMFALNLSDDRISLVCRRTYIIKEMRKLSENIKKTLRLDNRVLEIAHRIHREKSLLIMGRGYNFATCLEGALKIKELSYMHCEGLMSGELKHGPLAMVDESTCIIMVICNDHVYKKSLNALQQVLARGGRPIVIADESVPISDLPNVEFVLKVPTTADSLQSILTVIPLQILSYHIATLKGFNVDRPRNLAKSVTVE